MSTQHTAPLVTLNLPDPAPLRAALDALGVHAAQLIRLADEKAGLETKIADFVSGEHAADYQPQDYTAMAGNRLRLEVIPGIVKRMNEQRFALADNLVAEIEKFETALAAEGKREREAILDNIDAEIRHRVPGSFLRDGKEYRYSRQIAATFPEAEGIPCGVGQFNAPHLFERFNKLTWGDDEGQRDRNFVSTVEAAKRRAEALFIIHDRASKAGRFGKTPPEIARNREHNLAEERKKIGKPLPPEEIEAREAALAEKAAEKERLWEQFQQARATSDDPKYVQSAYDTYLSKVNALDAAAA